MASHHDIELNGDISDKCATSSSRHGDSSIPPSPIQFTDRPITGMALRHQLEQKDGQYVLELGEAQRQFGDEWASSLKTDKNGIVLWPQPLGPEDPQAWPERKKSLILFIMVLAAIVPDFDSALGIASMFGLAKTFHTTPDRINNLTSNWSIFLLGPGGVFAIIFVRRFGRLPVLFWTQVIGLAFLVGATFAPTLASFAVCRCLSGFFSTSSQVLGLYICTDLYPVHKQPTRVALWTFGYLASPFIPPFIFGYLAARQSWRWVYACGSIYSVIVVLLIAFCMEETLYDRHLDPVPARPTHGLRYRIETLLGLTAWKLRKNRTPMWKAVKEMLEVMFHPQAILCYIFGAIFFGFTVGINVTLPIFLAEPKRVGGFGFSHDAISTLYLVPIVSVFIGEALAGWWSRMATRWSVLHGPNVGTLQNEDLLLPTAPGTLLYLIGMLAFGAGLQHVTLAGIIIGWALIQAGCMVNLVALLSKLSLEMPDRGGEIAALVNWARVLFGFCIPYFQHEWVNRDGPMVVWGTEGGIVAALWLFTMVPLWLFGSRLGRRSQKDEH
ncbi:Synaptic vesicle transporter SVOP and related transporters (major facilitator superfamily) [Ceraceosorus bombacis]|uniref:Synaptic vesicle transporter SVOP and related transporters (Major facilitator superfamily) n=1 Tax=Ceraceosorus bombacis TaxID=401625 RepID=A0A0P1BC52_9BASI|nr:Synaptic vesicle transporter SVOP and related transporters (major facilitator superfamily) [Ceraceosorus bombacis]